jgi:eukaryotic-like serine/threonine-protein kinase
VAAPEPTPGSWHPLRNSRALAGLSDDTLQELFASARAQSFQAGETLMRQGDPAEGLLILLEGTAHAQLRDRDGAHVLGRFAGGDIVGEMALVTREPRSADVIADSAVQALLVPTREFDRLAMRHPALGAVLTELVADRLGQAAHDGFGGKTVEDFRILHCIGRGGMSLVYRAEDQATGEHVALKMMSYKLIYNSAALSRFHQESALLQRLHHGNIVRLKRLFAAFRTYFLVMELCEGVDLRRFVAKGGLPEPQVRAILGQLACALEYLHRQGIVHRDLKPANVMLTRGGQVKVMDFGLARPTVALEETQTATGQEIMGTPSYMAPEQLSGWAPDSRTDVYALGCIAYALLTGRHLFQATNLWDLVQEKSSVRLPPAGSIGAGVTPELYAFMQAALEVKPENRSSSAAALTAWAAPCDLPPLDAAEQEIVP